MVSILATLTKATTTLYRVPTARRESGHASKSIQCSATSKDDPRLPWLGYSTTLHSCSESPGGGSKFREKDRTAIVPREAGSSETQDAP